MMSKKAIGVMHAYLTGEIEVYTGAKSIHHPGMPVRPGVSGGRAEPGVR